MDAGDLLREGEDVPQLQKASWENARGDGGLGRYVFTA